MAEGLNHVILIGNLGQDPELRFTQSQQAVLSLSMATTESFFNKETKQRTEQTEWHSVIVWGKRGEALNKILSKGSRISVVGKLKTRSWDDKNGGGKRYATEIVANNVILLGGRGEGGGQGGHGGQAGYDNSGPAGDGGEQYGGDTSGFGDDDIPF